MCVFYGALYYNIKRAKFVILKEDNILKIYICEEFFFLKKIIFLLYIFFNYLLRA